MSRKIEDQMIAAIRAGRAANLGDTSVRQHGEGHSAVYLHNNLIAEIGHPVRGTRWTLAGWNTPTTRSRINALARAFNWKRVYNKGGKPFAAGNGPDHEVDPAAWVAAI